MHIKSDELKKFINFCMIQKFKKKIFLFKK